MDDCDFDALILAEVEPRYQKVAMVAVRVFQKIGHRSPSSLIFGPMGDDTPDPLLTMILKRIESLSASGKLDAMGDLSSPRHSEIRAARPDGHH